jgi:catechol 2,3-dioxygenase-like lactoylglutathione lyase family enzyme
VTALRAAPILGVRDVAATAAYFRDRLGFELDPETGLFAPDPDEGAVYAIVRMGDVAVHLQIRRREVFVGRRESIETDAYVTVDDVDATYARHRDARVEIHRPIDDSPYGMRDYCIATPDGHRIAFGSPLRR